MSLDCKVGVSAITWTVGNIIWIGSTIIISYIYFFKGCTINCFIYLIIIKLGGTEKLKLLESTAYDS